MVAISGFADSKQAMPLVFLVIPNQVTGYCTARMEIFMQCNQPWRGLGVRPKSIQLRTALHTI
jgi:hypothetical protein